jgi:hypothetical protein
MAIREFSPDGSPRAKIAFVGDMPCEEDLKRFTERGFHCELLKSEQLHQYAAQLDAVVWTQDRHKPNTLPRELAEIAPKLLDNDARVYVRLAVDENLTAMPRTLVVNAIVTTGLPVGNLRPDEWRNIPSDRQERQGSSLLPCVYIVDSGEPWAYIATLVCDRPASPSFEPGPTFKQHVLKKPLDPKGQTERVLLLKRAFWDCSNLKLARLDGGMSGAPVFRVYASLRAGLVQPPGKLSHPHLYFVKIGPRKKIVDEYDKYGEHIFDYVPFYLGPRLRPDRCNLGSTQGILVGDFVEGAESLIACARGGRCGHAIANLFDRTLGGWRKQAYVYKTHHLSKYFEDKWWVEGSSNPIALPADRAVIVKDLGGDTDIAALKQIFEAHGQTWPLCAPAHGDMHAGNVLVRHGDAILIDFEKVKHEYPLTYDPASLEGGLLVEGFTEEIEKAKLKPAELVALINPLYERLALVAPSVSHCHPGDAAEWYYNAVNQIRALSWSAENEAGQYALTLALCLIRKGCNTHNSLLKKGPTAARAVAFYFGQKILRDMASG